LKEFGLNPEDLEEEDAKDANSAEQDDIIKDLFGFEADEEEKEFDNPLLDLDDEFDQEDGIGGYLDFGL